MIQLDDALSPFLLTLVLLRQNVSYDADNRPVYAAPTTLQTVGSMQEVSNKTLKLVPEGEYTEDTKIWYTTDSLRYSQDSGVLTGDRIVFDGSTYKIIAKGDWIANGYQIYVLTKLDPDV